MDPATLLASTQTWSAEQKWDAALWLWASVAESGWQPEPDAELDAELDRRVDAHEANPEKIRTSEEVWERIRGLR